MSFVELEKVSKSFGDNAVLRNVDLEVGEHEVVCLIGASGSGKSTLLRCVNLLEPIDSGRISVDGQTITNGKVDANAVRRNIGIVFQAFNLFPHMTVLQNVTLAPRNVRKMPRAEAAQQAQNFSNTYYNFTSYVVAAVFFIFLTIPLARFTDHLIAIRERKERAAAI